MSDVARRARTSPGTVIYYFGTKHQLFHQAIAAADADFYASLWPELDEIESGTARLARLIHRSSTSDWVLWVDLWAYARRHADMLEASIDFHRRWCGTIADVIGHGQLRGEFSARDAKAIAVRFAALSNGLAIRMVLDDCPAPRTQYLAMSVEAAALELDCDADELRRELAAVPVEVKTEQADRETEEAA